MVYGVLNPPSISTRGPGWVRPINLQSDEFPILLLEIHLLDLKKNKMDMFLELYDCAKLDILGWV
jgi:hypothetical protein